MMKRLLFLFAFSSVLAIPVVPELNEQSVFGGQIHQELSYENQINQSGIPFLEDLVQFNWYEPLSNEYAQSPWTNRSIHAGGALKFTPYDAFYQIHLGINILPFFNITGRYTQNIYFANLIPITSDSGAFSELNPSHLRSSIGYDQLTPSVNYYQSFGILFQLTGNLFTPKLPGSLSFEHIYLDRTDDHADAIYDPGLDLPIYTNDELFQINIQTHWLIDPKWKLGIQYNSLRSNIQNGLFHQHGGFSVDNYYLEAQYQPCNNQSIKVWINNVSKRGDTLDWNALNSWKIGASWILDFHWDFSPMKD